MTAPVTPTDEALVAVIEAALDDVDPMPQEAYAALKCLASRLPSGGWDDAKSVEPQVDVIEQAKTIAYQDGWRDAILAARDGCRLIPPDAQPKHVHAFAAETVLRAVEKGARDAGVRFAERGS